MRHRRRSGWDRLARSGVLTFGALTLVLAAVAALWIAHTEGRIHKLTTTEDTSEHMPSEIRPGGQPLVYLSRPMMSGSMAPELTALTVAPGDGMLVLQALLQRPGRPEIPILMGTAEDQYASVGQLLGAEFHAEVELRESLHASTTVDVDVVAGHPATGQNTSILPGGTRCEARFSPNVAVAGGSTVRTGIETTVSASTTSHGLDLSILARNTGTAPRGVTLDWRPRFLAPDGGLKGFSVVPPPERGRPSGEEQPLGVRSFDRTYSDLQHSYLSTGADVRLKNHVDGYTIRLTALTPSMRSIRVQADKDSNAVLVDVSTAAGDGRASSTTLMPGEKLEWKLRVEALAYPLGGSGSP